MSLSAAISSSVSGLLAQSAQISAVSENIANSSTIAYKTRGINFRSLVTGNGSNARQVNGGVVFNQFQNVRQQGLIEATGSVTDIAVNGNGFFVVSDSLTNQPSGYTYSRNGGFQTDEQGFLINGENYYLLGQRTDEEGNVEATNPNDLSSLEPIDVNAISGTAQPTSRVRFDLNLPADSPAIAPDNVYTNSIELNDSLGVAHNVPLTWTKNAANDWTLTFGSPTQVGVTPPVTTGEVLIEDSGGGTFTAAELNITFNGDGSIGSFTDSSGNPLAADEINLRFSGPAAGPADLIGTGANPQDVRLDMGNIGTADGVTQFSSNSSVPQIEIVLIDQDGLRFGQLSGVEVNDDGLVIAFFENGVRLPVYQVPIATFPNPDDLTHINGTVYDESEEAGSLNLRPAGQGNAGEIVASAVELSTTDSSVEFNKMIISQQAYSSGAQVISTASDLFDELIGAVR